VIHERLVVEHGFDGHYQRVKVYVREHRARLAAADPAPAGFHRRFEVLPGAQAQVDWGDEGEVQTATGPLHAFSFHMTLAYSRDPFCCFTAGQDLATFWDCHRRAFAHFGGVPAVVVYDRTKTVVRRHVGRGQATPLHPEAVAFAEHYGFAIWLAAAYRPQSKGRVERQVEIIRSHVLAGRVFDSLAAMDAAVATWLPVRRAATHRTHGEVIAVRAERDRAALGLLPERPYLVVERHTRRVGKDALISFVASHYSVPWRQVRPGSRVELRITPAEVAVWSLGRHPRMLAVHARAAGRGAWVVDAAHWDGLPNRADAEPLPRCAADCELVPPKPEPGQLELPGISGWVQAPAARIQVARRRLAVYEVGSGQECALKVCLAQVGMNDDAAFEVDRAHPGPCEVGVLELGAGELGPRKVGVAKVD